MLAGRCLAAPSRGVLVPIDKRGMGMVFQSYAIWPHLTVFENVAFPLRVRRQPKAAIEKGVREALELVGLGGLEQRGATELSGGQQQRVALARAIVYTPTLLLLDEPLSNLDVKLREQMRTELHALHRRLHLAVVYVTHDQGEALALSDRIAVVNQGRLEQVGTPTRFTSGRAPASSAIFSGAPSFSRAACARRPAATGSTCRARAASWRRPTVPSAKANRCAFSLGPKTSRFCP